MELVTYSDDEVVSIKELTALYESVEWTSYAVDPDGLARAVDRSSYVVTARDADGVLIGLARCLSDDVHLVYIQDVLVRPDRQRQGIGRMLIARTLKTYEHVRQVVLMTDDAPEQRAFYEALGFNEANQRGLINFVKIS